MTLKKKAITVLSGAVLALGSALPAYALVSVSLGGQSDAQTNGSVSLDTHAKAGVSAAAGSKASNTFLGAASDSVQATGNASASVDADPLIITRTDVQSNAVAPNTKSAASVKTKDDLSGYVAAKLATDANLTQVQTSAKKVALTYKTSARLLGFIPVMINATANVDESGNVSLQYPWWTFLAATNSADLETKLQSRIDADLAASASANAGSSLSEADQAKVIADLESTLSADLNANARATSATK